MRGGMTPGGVKQTRIGGIVRAGAEVGKDLMAKRRELAEILEAE